MGTFQACGRSPRKARRWRSEARMGSVREEWKAMLPGMSAEDTPDARVSRNPRTSFSCPAMTVLLGLLTQAISSEGQPYLFSSRCTSSSLTATASIRPDPASFCCSSERRYTTCDRRHHARWSDSEARAWRPPEPQQRWTYIDGLLERE
jgi:hypothetical protein